MPFLMNPMPPMPQIPPMPPMPLMPPMPPLTPLWNLLPIPEEQLAVAQEVEPIYAALDLHHLHKNYLWTTKCVVTTSDWHILQRAARQYPFITDARWHQRAYNIHRCFKGVSIVEYLCHLESIGGQCEICYTPVFPLKVVDDDDEPGGTRKLLVGNVDHTHHS